MTIGIGTYAMFWQWHATASQPISLPEMITKTAGWGVTLFQICDYPLIESYDDDELAALRTHAEGLGVALELGTRGVSLEHLGRYLDLAQALDVRLVRSMINTADHRPSAAEAVELLAETMPRYQAAGVTVALETYEQVPVDTLIDIVRQVDSPALGICLDPGNCVAALETPTSTIERTAPYVRNLHVKDFAFSRQDGWVGFTFAGCPLGEGLLDYDFMIDAVRPHERDINQIIEHWLPWQGDSATTCHLEDQWTLGNLHYLRSKEA
ncbi:MAG TPA: TIM barrel protein [Propionibacteriaceae bacterium]|nr:TIM barrel protein [Propionibacteriaceae bacterium]